MLTPKSPVLGMGVYKARIFIWHYVCICVQYLVREVTVLKERPLFNVGVYVSKGGKVPINLLF